jgi:hypothetical protein
VPLLQVHNREKILVVDCGGGTVDITAHLVYENETDDASSPVVPSATCSSSSSSSTLPPVKHFAELVPPSGGLWGSTVLDRLFEDRFLLPLLGAARFHSAYMRAGGGAARADMLCAWEQVKRGFTGADDR